MAFQNVPGGPMLFPEPSPSGSANPLGMGSLLLDANAEKGAIVFTATKSGNIDRIEVATRTITTGDTLDARIETVDMTTGFPTGTLWNLNGTGAAPNAAIVIGSADDNSWKASATLTNVAAVVRGDIVAVVIVHPNTANALNLAILNLSTNAPIFTLPYGLNDIGGAGYQINNQPLCLALHYDDGTYAYLGPNVWPVSVLQASSAFGSGSTPDEVGNRISLPWTVKVSGLWVHADFDGDADVVLYDSDGVTPLKTVAVDANVHFGVAPGIVTLPFTSDVTLTANTVYREIVKPGAATVTVREITVDSAGIMDAFTGGQSIYHTSAKDPSGVGSWTDNTLKRVQMGLLISAIDDGAPRARFQLGL